MVVFTLLLSRVHVFATTKILLIWTEKCCNERVNKTSLKRTTYWELLSSIDTFYFLVICQFGVLRIGLSNCILLVTSNGVLFVGLDLRKNILKTKSWRNFREGKPVCEDSVITYTRMRGVADTFCPNVERKYFALWRGVEKVVRGVTSEYTRCLRPAVISRASSSPYLHKFNVKRKFLATKNLCHACVFTLCPVRLRKARFSQKVIFLVLIEAQSYHLKVYNLVRAFSTKYLGDNHHRKKSQLYNQRESSRDIILQN